MKKQSIETFSRVGSYDLNGLIMEKPSAMNGDVRVTKTRVTVEEIKESKEVIQERIKELWIKGDNYHHREPLKSCAKKYGLDLDDSKFGEEK